MGELWGAKLTELFQSKLCVTWEANSDDIGTNMKCAPRVCMEQRAGFPECSSADLFSGALQH